MKDEIKSKDKVIKILLENYSNRVPEHLNYVISKRIQQIENNMHSSTACNNQRAIMAIVIKIDKNERKLNENCNNEDSRSLDLNNGKYESGKVTEQTIRKFPVK